MLFNRKASFSASTETLSSVTSTSSSSTLLKKPSTQPKNYSGAFATLQNQYGFSGSAPAPVTLPKASKSKSTVAPSAQPSPKTTKDYEAAYGALCSSYGFGGAPSYTGKK